MARKRGSDGRPRPSNPIQGDDVFRTRSSKRQSSPFFKLSADDGDDFWANLDERNAQHRQHVKWLVVAVLLISAAALIVHTVLFGFALILLIPTTVELLMIRRTRSRSKIPDYRQSEPAEIELDDT